MSAEHLKRHLGRHVRGRYLQRNRPQGAVRPAGRDGEGALPRGYLLYCRTVIINP